jgi:allantoinase
MHDLVIRGGQVVTGASVISADVAIEDERISEIGQALGAGTEEIDARGLTIFPGVIDVHVHFNEPGRTNWEGSATGSRALAAGGGTLFFDMPLNSTPCTVSCTAFDRKRAALERSSIIDFALWGGLVPGNTSELPELAERGVVGLKAFLCDSGLPEFPRVDEPTLLEGMRVAASYGLPVAVHAESQAITSALAREAIENGRTSVGDYLASRPVRAEIEAIQFATAIAEDTGAKLHIVHVSSGSGVRAAAEARARGVDVSIETCPHYLFFTAEDMERLGAVAKCAPPLRSNREREDLWTCVLDGSVEIIGSDHSPAPLELKSGPDFFHVWGGIAGIQATLAVLLEEGYHRRGLPLERIGELLSSRPAQRFNILKKGAIQVGHDADLAIVRLFEPFIMDAGSLLQRHAISPYIGSQFRGKIERTLLRGKLAGTRAGRFVRPRVQSIESNAPPRSYA